MSGVTCNNCGAWIQANPGAFVRCGRCGNAGLIPLAAPAAAQPIVIQQQAPRRSILVAYLLWFFFGFFGIHRFYMGDTVIGVIYLLTGALCGLGWLIDMVVIPFSINE